MRSTTIQGVMTIIRKSLYVLALTIGAMLMMSCSGRDVRPTDAAPKAGPEAAPKAAKIVFLHHSTGQVVWTGSTSKVRFKLTGKGDVQNGISEYNRSDNASLEIEEVAFPTGNDYPWDNYPYDYHNIWVKHAGDAPYRGEPTLEMLTKRYDVIIWKHCFPVGNILPDTGRADVDSDAKRLENYKLQYAGLKDKMRSFPDTKFIVWTGAALTRGSTSGEEAQRARQFFDWVKSEWDEPGDNIFVWDFYELETEGGLYLKDTYASAPSDSHPRSDFAGRVAPLLVRRIVDVVQGRGDSTSLTGEAR